MEIEQKIAGFTSDGEAVVEYVMRNTSGSEVRLCNIGAAITSVRVPDRNGVLADVALGYADLSDYMDDGPCLGKIPGRYANRIARGRFTLDGVEYRLPVNNGPNSLHGGPKGFANRVWEGRVEGDRVVFAYDSPDGEQGYPSALYAEAVYDWDDDNVLSLTLLAQSNGPTVINLTNHAYFNLSGESSGSVLGHSLQLFAGRFLPTDPTLVPTGEEVSVEGTPMDFREPKALGRDIKAPFAALEYGKGYDNCWVIDGWREGEIRPAARLADPVSGRVLTVSTDQPGVQIYTGNWLSGSPTGKSGRSYEDYDGVAIECQGFPDAPNRPSFPSQVLRKGERYERRILFAFSAE